MNNEPELTHDMVKELLPKRSSFELVENTTETLNKLLTRDEPEFRNNFRDNLIGYSNVLQSGRYKLTDYVNAVRFVCFRLAGDSFALCYQKTFPERYKRLVREGKDDKAISSYVSAYSSNKLVTVLLEQAAIPVSVLNADIFQEAINVQAVLMRSASSELIRQKAADSLMTHLRPPDTAKISVDVTVSQADALSELREVSRELARAQLHAIEDKTKTVLEIAHTPILKTEIL